MLDVKIISGQTITASGQSAALNAAGPRLDIEIEVTTVSGTTPSATFSVLWSEDGTNFAAPQAAQSFPAVTAAGNMIAQFPALGPYWQLAWTVSGTTPSFTFSVYQSDT